MDDGCIKLDASRILPSRITSRRVFEVAADIEIMTEHGDKVTIPAGTQIPVLEDVTYKFREP